MLHLPSPSFVDLNILPNVFPSAINHFRFVVSSNAHVSQAHVVTGLITI